MLRYLGNASYLVLALAAAGQSQAFAAGGRPENMEEALRIIAQLEERNKALLLENHTLREQLTRDDAPPQSADPDIPQVNTVLKMPETAEELPAPLQESPKDYYIRPRLDAYVKMGNDRTITGTELFFPLSWNGEYLTFGDIRISADDNDGREGNLGFGFRHIPSGRDFLVGAYGFFDRRVSELNNMFSQMTFGLELLTEDLDFRTNFYQSLSETKYVGQTETTNVDFSGHGLVASRYLQTTSETPLSGMDFETGIKLPFFEDARVYGGFYHFDHDDSDTINGLRARARMRVTDWLQLGYEYQHDNIRGETSYAELRLRFPLGGYSSRKTKPQGIYARLDEQVIRDIDIVTRPETRSSTPVSNAAVLNAATGTPPVIYHVDNTSTPGGNGSIESPFNVLADAQAAAAANEIIYVHSGDGTSAGQNSGITLAKLGQKLIGAGVSLTFANLGLVLNGFSPNTIAIKASTPPVISNTAGIGITVSANDVEIAGLSVKDITNSGIYISNADNISVHDVTVDNIGNATTHYGIFAQYNAAGSYNLDLSRNTVRNVFQDAVYILTQGTAVLNSTIEGNSFSNSGRYGLHVRSEATSVSNPLISGNTVFDNSNYGIMLNSLGGSSLTENVTGNIISGNSSYGIHQYSQGTSTLNGSVTQNHIFGNNSYGISFLTADTSGLTVTASENTVEDNTSSAIYARSTVDSTSNVTFTGNILRGNTATGIVIRSESNSTMNGTVSGNTISGNTGYGVTLVGTDTSSTTGSITGNNITGNTSSGFYMNALLGGSVNGTATNNHVSGNGAHGAYIYSQNTSSLTANLSGNSFIDNSNNGVQFNSVDSGVITGAFIGNTISGSNSYGLYLYSTVSGVINGTFSGNTISNNSSYGLYLYTINSGSINGTYSDNVIAGNKSFGVYLRTANDSSQTSTFIDNIVTGNRTYGYYFNSANNSFISAMLQGNTVTGTENNGYGLFFNDDSTLAMTFDMGGGALGSTGQNRVFGNRLEEIRLDLDGGTLKAENNWWGTAAGLLPSEISKEQAASNIDADPYLTSDPQQ